MFDNFIKFDNKCSICSKTFNDNNLNYCYECKLYFCNNCKNRHSINSHVIIKAYEKNIICKLHHKNYDKFCFNCKINLCELCEHKNKDHYVELIKDIYPSDKDINNFNEILIEKMNLLCKKENDIKEKIEKINKLKITKLSKDERN